MDGTQDDGTRARRADTGPPGAGGAGRRPRRVGRRGRRRALGVVLAVLAVALAGVVIGVLPAPTRDRHRPVQRRRSSIRPSLAAAPTWSSRRWARCMLDSHDGPAHLTVQLGALDQSRTKALIEDPDGITGPARARSTTSRDGLVRLGLPYRSRVRCSARCSSAALVFRDIRRAAWAGGVALAVTGGSLGIGGA